MKNFIILLTIFIFSGCAQVTLTGQARDPVDEKEVKILFYEKPECQYEELALITTPTHWSETYAIEDLRAEAAKIGSDFVSVQQIITQPNGFVIARGLAYICGTVNRENVDVHKK